MGISQKFWINLIGFQAIWWLSILHGNTAAIFVALLIFLHFYFHSSPESEVLIVLVTAILGFWFDMLLAGLNFFIFPNQESGFPFWLLLLWMGFCSTLRQSLGFFRGRYLLSSVCGALAGSLTYLTAARLGAVELGLSELHSLLILAIIWSGLFPLLIFISNRMSLRYEMSSQ